MSTEITVPELLGKLDRGEPVLLLDVRNEDEFGSWKLEGRRPANALNVPYFAFLEEPDAALARVPEAQSEIAVLCAKGGSSEFVADLLRESGIAARSVVGGMRAYGSHLEPVRVSTESIACPEIWQFNRRGKGCLSYVLRSGNEAIVVDPSRHVQVYLNFAAESGASLTRVLDTHVHADHLSGGPELARQLGIPYSAAAGMGFDMQQNVTTLRDGEELDLGGMSASIKVLSTPGHTPGSTCYLVGKHFLLSGDTLFVNGVGRPDLGGDTASWAKSLFDSLQRRIGALSDDIVVLPAHYSSQSEIGPDGVVSARLGQVRASAPEFRMRTEQEFVAGMTQAASSAPAAYAEILRVNLGLAEAEEEEATEWELGKNECAAQSK